MKKKILQRQNPPPPCTAPDPVQLGLTYVLYICSICMFSFSCPIRPTAHTRSERPLYNRWFTVCTQVRYTTMWSYKARAACHQAIDPPDPAPQCQNLRFIHSESVRARRGGRTGYCTRGDGLQVVAAANELPCLLGHDRTALISLASSYRWVVQVGHGAAGMDGHGDGRCHTRCSPNSLPSSHT